jgi:hypothetical protein
VRGLAPSLDVLDLVLDPSSQLLGLFLGGVEEPHGSSSLYALRSQDSDGATCPNCPPSFATSLLLDFEPAGRSLKSRQRERGVVGMPLDGSSGPVASTESARVCSELGLERWWPDPASVEHAREVGLLPEVRIP